MCVCVCVCGGGGCSTIRRGGIGENDNNKEGDWT